MAVQTIDNPATMIPATQPSMLVEVRGPESGHLYGRLDPIRGLLEVKRKGGLVEVIDLKRLLGQVRG